LILLELETRNFRNLADGKIAFHPAANIFIGDNGQGKTNLLEAIYFLATTKSFRTSRVAHAARTGETTLYTAGRVQEPTGIVRTLSAGLAVGPERRRELLLNGQKATLGNYIRALQVFAYSAARLEILRGGPDERRRFLDRGIASVRPGYLSDLSRYGRVLKQRNSLLQQIAEGKRRGKELDAWDRELVETALAVVEARRIYTEELAARTEAILEEHDYHVRDLRFAYRPAGFEEGIGLEEGVRALGELRKRELRLGYTLFGPHRDNIEILRGDDPAAEILSSGEIKMTVLFLKLAKVELYRERTGESPLFLLDDVDAELDLSIIERLLSYLIGRIQLFTTSPKGSFFDRFEMGEHARFGVRNGGVAPEGES